MSTEEKNLKAIAKIKGKLISAIITIVIFNIIVMVIFFVGYTNASEKYKNAITELEKEVERLSNPIAVYDITSK